MKILICSHVFAPSIGGIETVSSVLAEQFTRMGSQVVLVTQTPGETSDAGYKVLRRPTVSKLLALGRWADVVFQSQISLQTLLPLLLVRRPIFITCHGLPRRGDGTLGWQDRLKHAAFRLCHTLAISEAVANGLPQKSTVVGNPFDAAEFTVEEGIRDKDIVFLGRLVSDKGCALALRALAILKENGCRPSFTVIGDGSEMAALKQLSADLGISDQVDFRGSIREGRGRELARHKIMVIPSLWAEPFGVVALEGLAAGCVLASANAGGLPEAVGPCGLLFPSGDAEALARVLHRLLTEPGLRQTLLAERPRHLERFQPENVARRYLEIFTTALKN